MIHRYLLACTLSVLCSAVWAFPPEPHDDVILTNEPDFEIRISELLSNDIDPDGDVLRFLGYPDDIVNGSASINDDVIEWRFASGETRGQFTYLVDDGSGQGWGGSYGYAHVFIELTSTPVPTPTPTPVPSPRPTPTPVPSPLPTPVPTPTPVPSPLPTPVPTPTPVSSPSPHDAPISSCGISKRVNQYVFGHSLISHGLSPNARQTNVPYWLTQFSNASGYSYSAAGQYGFLPEAPARDLLGWEGVSPGWDTNFSDSNFNQLLVTVFNFGLDNAPDVISHLGATPTVELQNTIEWANDRSPGITTYLYESWPAMDDYIAPWPATEAQFDEYNMFTMTTNAAWWDQLAASAPVEFIPVARLLAELYGGILDDIPVTELYEDGAPHGTANTYFLASVIVYMAIYDEMPPHIDLPNSIHPIIRENYGNIVYFISTRLSNY